MNTPATPFFRDVRMPSAWNDKLAYERFQMDTLAERRAPERPPSRMTRVRAALTAALKLG